MNKLTFKEKLGFSVGEIGATISWQGMMFFLAFFYTDVYGLSATVVGFLMFLPRFIDAFIDPIAGVIADRTKSRWGKFRPWLLWLSAPFAILMVLMYVTPNFSMNGKIIYAYVTYISMMVVYSMILTPFNALGGVLTGDHRDRTDLQTFRFTMAFVGAIIVRGVTLPLASALGNGYNPTTNLPNNPQQGFFYTMIVFAIISFILFIVAFKTTKERVQPLQEGNTDIKDDLKDLITNKPWLALFATSIFNLIWVGIWSAATAYYFKYYVAIKTLTLFGWNTGYDSFSVFNVFSSILIVITLVSPLTKWLTNKMGKRNTLALCLSLVSIAIGGFFFCKPEDIGLIMFFQLLQSVAAAATMPTIWSMYADAADYSEWKTNRRATGLVYSAVVFGQKVGIALGAAIPLWIMGAWGYSATITEQSPEIITIIRLSMSFIPAVFVIVTAILTFTYKLTDAEMDKIQLELAERRNK